MATTTERPRRYAVLIDADNAQPSILDGVFNELAKTGELAVKRIYGDFTSQSSSGWKKHLNAHAIRPVQQFAYTTGKNASDSALIIDAMDLMYTRRFEGFALVSSDSDFTGLATRLREEGLEVIGFGEEKTPDAFRNACHRFVLTEVLRPVSKVEVPLKQAKKAPAAGAASPVKTTTPTAPAGPTPLALDFIRRGIEETSDDSGWAHLGALGSYLNKLQPDFDPRRYGFKQLSQLLRSDPRAFTVEERSTTATGGKVLYVRVNGNGSAQAAVVS